MRVFPVSPVTRPEMIDERLILARYKRLILLGKVALPLAEARRIVGPDCAYHLYFRHAGGNAAAGEDGPKGKAEQRRLKRRHK